MLSAPYQLYREDFKGQRFYWFRREDGTIAKDIGITSLASRVIPEGRELVTWQLQKDPDGRLLELSATHGTLEHICIDRLDNGLEWQSLIPENYPYERMVNGSVFSWRKFCDDYKVEVLASELSLRYEKGDIHFSATLDKVVYLTKIVKEKQTVEDGLYKVGEKKGTPKYKEITVEKEVKELAIVDLKSNFFEKDTKSFYEAHTFQLWGQRLAFMQSFPEMGVPNLYNWSPANFKTRTAGLENLYTFFAQTKDYEWDFNYYMIKAIKKGLLEPRGRIEVFTNFTKETPLNECYMALTYDEFIERKLKGQETEENKISEPLFLETDN